MFCMCVCVPFMQRWDEPDTWNAGANLVLLMCVWDFRDLADLTKEWVVVGAALPFTHTHTHTRTHTHTHTRTVDLSILNQ